MLEKITDAEIDERSMANVSTTPGRRTAFGESGMDDKALKLRFDRLGRFLAIKLNEIFDGISNGNLAQHIKIKSNVAEYSLSDFILRMIGGDLTQIKAKTPEGEQRLDVICNQVLRWQNEIKTGDLAHEIVIIDSLTLTEFYNEFKKFEENAGKAAVESINGRTGNVVLNANDVGARPHYWMPTYSDVGAEKSGTAASTVGTHNIDEASHNDIRLELQRLAGIIADLLDSDDTTLDETHEIVAYIKSNKTLIEAITTSKVNVTDIINDLVTNVSNKPLSAAQGVALKAFIDALDTNKLNASALDEAIRTALAEAKKSGMFDGSAGKNAFEYAQDGGYVGTEEEFAEKMAKEMPAKTSDLENDSGFITKEDAPVLSVNGKNGAVSLSAADVGARPSSWMPSYSDVNADKAGTAQSLVSSHNTNDAAHNDIRLELQRLGGIIADLLDSDDTTLDETHEIVAYIKSNKTLIEAITTSKVNVTDIINDLVTNLSNKPLSAAQGVALKELIDALDTNKLDASALAEAINIALARAKENGDFKGETGAEGQRGTGTLKVSTAPSNFTTETAGVVPIKRMLLSTIIAQSGVSEVLIGDCIGYSYYQYHIYYVDDNYAYMDNYQSIRGATGSPGANGTSVTVSSVTESTESGGSNVVSFSDGKTLTVKNGEEGAAGKSAYQYAKEGGYTGTEADFISKIAQEFTTETWTFELENGSTVTKKVVLA